MAKIRIMGRFGVTPIELLNSPTASWKAKGIYAYIQSKPDGWNFSADRMKDDATDGKDGTLTGIKELIKLGYLVRTRTKNESGQFDWEYELLEIPIKTSPSRDLPSTVKPANNKERLSKGDADKSDVALKPFVVEDELQKLESKENSAMDIIATFIRKKGVQIENKKQLQNVIRRYVRIANQLSGAYTNKQIFDATNKLIKDNEFRRRKGEEEIDFTLETVYKQLTK